MSIATVLEKVENTTPDQVWIYRGEEIRTVGSHGFVALVGHYYFTATLEDAMKSVDQQKEFESGWEVRERFKD